jgi:hypothetical protein
MALHVDTFSDGHLIDPLVTELSAQCTLGKMGIEMATHYFVCFWQMILGDL